MQLAAINIIAIANAYSRTIVILLLMIFCNPGNSKIPGEPYLIDAFCSGLAFDYEGHSSGHVGRVHLSLSGVNNEVG